MAYVECGNGHIYDSDVNASCPYCNGGVKKMDFQEDRSSIGKTAPIGTNSTGGSEIGATVAPSNYRAAAAKEEGMDDAGKTVAVSQRNMSREPVVGWFVCIEGPDKGRDFRILARNNTIGRGDRMDICIKGDTTISRENHARIGYDEKHNAFHLIPGESANNIYINDQPVYTPTKIDKGQIIEMGDTKLMFVPFCDDNFNWNDGLK